MKPKVSSFNAAKSHFVGMLNLISLLNFVQLFENSLDRLKLTARVLFYQRWRNSQAYTRALALKLARDHLLSQNYPNSIE